MVTNQATKTANFFHCKQKAMYHLVGNFGGANVWRKQMDKDLGKKSLVNEEISQKVINCNY